MFCKQTLVQGVCRATRVGIWPNRATAGVTARLAGTAVVQGLRIDTEQLTVS